MPHRNNTIEAYLTRLHLLGEHVKTLHNATARQNKKQGVGHREHHFSKIALSTLWLASFTIHLLFPPCNHKHIHIRVQFKDPQLYTHELHLRTYISETHLATIPQSDPGIVSDTSTLCHGGLLYLFCRNLYLCLNVGLLKYNIIKSRDACTWRGHKVPRHQCWTMM